MIASLLLTCTLSARRLVGQVSTMDVFCKDRNYLKLSGPTYLLRGLVALADWKGGLHTYVRVKMDHGDLSPS